LLVNSISTHRTEAPIEARAELRLSPDTNTHPIVMMPLSGPDCPGPRIAIIDLDGPILNRNASNIAAAGENPVSFFQEKLSAVEATPGVVAVVLRINSTGGSVTATEMLWDQLVRFRARTRLPMVACVLDFGTGGAYYLASAADRIVAYPSSLLGGIGVTINLYNLRETMATLNVFPQTVKAGDQIDLGTVQEELSPEGRAILQRLADEFHEAFIRVVRASRPGLPPVPAPIYDGRVFSGRQALELGLIDRVGTLELALDLAREMGGVPVATAAIFHREGDVARTPYAVTRNDPPATSLVPLNVPGLNQRDLPTFLYQWEPRASMR
jgi:protease-4